MRQPLISDWRRVKMNFIRHCTLAVLVLLFTHAALASADDGFIRGYASAVLEREFHVTVPSLNVENGIITLKAEEIQEAGSSGIITELLKIQGVKRVELLGDEQHKAERANVPDDKASAPLATNLSEAEETGGPTVQKNGKDLFAPLIADPRWPHFSVAYHRYTNGGGLKSVGAISFGETLPLYKGRVSDGGEWQVGLQAAVFAVFDLSTPSWDLQNEDYIAALPFVYRKDSFSALVRLFHQSSHIGDELLLHSKINRVNFSYEALDLKLSHDLRNWLRVYGGGEYAFSRKPKNLKPWATQYGFELTSPKKYLHGILRPVAGADFKNREENNWHSEVSVSMGVQIENSRDMWHRWQIMLGYYNGNSPNGQFHDELIELLSLGAHFYF
jgi:hypothetical protein